MYGSHEQHFEFGGGHDDDHTATPRAFDDRVGIENDFFGRDDALRFPDAGGRGERLDCANTTIRSGGICRNGCCSAAVAQIPERHTPAHVPRHGKSIVVLAEAPPRN